MARVEFFFDISSPWTYLGFENIQPMAADLGVDIEWRPILVGGIFNSTNPSVLEARANPIPAKLDYMAKDLAEAPIQVAVRSYVRAMLQAHGAEPALHRALIHQVMQIGIEQFTELSEMAIGITNCA